MSQNPLGFRDQLLQCEVQTPALREKYEREVQAMFEKRLGVAGRGMYVFWTVFMLFQVYLFTGVAVTTYGEVSPWITVLFGVGVLFALAAGGLTGWIAYSGRLMLKTQPSAMVRLMWSFIVITATVLMFASPNSIVGLRMLLIGLFFMLMVSVFLVTDRTEQAELRTKEKLLEVEYRLAELSEKIGPSQKS